MEGLDPQLTAWMTKIENQIADMRCLEGKPRAQMCCRALGPRFVWKCALGSPSSGGHKVSPISVAWKTLAGWLKDVAIGVSQGHNLQLSLKAKRAKWLILSHQWDNIGTSIHARALVKWQQSITMEHLDDRARLDRLRVSADLVADRTSSYDINRSRLAWAKWVLEGPAKGLGKMPRMTKVATGWIPSPVVKASAATDALSQEAQVGDDDFLEIVENVSQFPTTM